MRIISSLSRWRSLRAACGVWLALTLTAGTPWLQAADYFVNAGTGNDSDNGSSSGLAFKTITHALSVAGGGDTIHVEPGLYDTANTETFPLVLKSGVKLQGAGAGSVTVINVDNGGSGYATPPEVTFSGGGGLGAEAFAVLDGDAVDAVIVTGGGGGYTSAPTVVFSSGAATATAVIGPGVSTISGPEGSSVFHNTGALNDATELSGFYLKHDTSAVDDDILTFEVNGIVEPAIRNNAFVDYESVGNGDTGIRFFDDSASDGAFLATIENNTMSGLYVGTWMSSTAGDAVGGAGDNFSPTIQDNTFSSVDYPIDFSISSSQGGDVQPNVLRNSTWGATDAFYGSAEMGEDFDTWAPVISNNTFRQSQSYGVYSEATFYSGAHNWAPRIMNNTLTMDSTISEGMSINASINDSEAQDQTLKPVITGNTITGDMAYGIDLTLARIAPADGADITFSPTIDSNTITGASDYGIFVSLTQFSDGHLVSNMSVSGNRIEDAGTGIYAEVFEFYDTDIDSLNFDWVIANNTITDAGGTGIRLTLTSMQGAPTGAVNTLISANTISDPRGGGIAINYSPRDPSSIDSDLRVEGNMITTPGDSGIDINYGGAGSGEEKVQVRGNTISGGAGDGLLLNFTEQTNAPVTDFRVSDNRIEGNAGHGIDVAAMDDVETPIIFSCNTVTGNGTESQSGAYYGVYIASEGVGTESGGTGVDFGSGTPESPGHNQFVDNVAFEFYNNNNDPINAMGNWWGTTVGIDDLISDDEEESRGAVDFSAFLTSSNQITHAIAADINGTVVNDADSSNGPTVGDTIRFCTTITGGAECGTGAGMTVTIPLPPNGTLVEGSITTDHGTVHPGEPYITITGVVLDEGEVMNVCFDVIANSGTEISATVTADGPDVDAASDTATLALAVPAVVEPVPTTGEWGLILLAAVLGLAGLFAMRRGGLAVLLIAACLVAAAPRPALAAPAKRVQVERQRPEGVQVKEVQSRGEQTTLVLADGRRFTVDTASLEIRDRRMTRDERRAARQEAKRDGARAARKPRHAQNKLSAKDLAAIVSTPAASGAAQPATLGLALRNGKVESLRVTLYASQQQVEAAMTRRDAADSRASQRAASAKK